MVPLNERTTHCLWVVSERERERERERPYDTCDDISSSSHCYGCETDRNRRTPTAIKLMAALRIVDRGLIVGM